MKIKSMLAIKEFDLHIKESINEYNLTIVAYGDIWYENFSNKEHLEQYLKNEWFFTKEQIQELYNNSANYNLAKCIKQIIEKG